VDADGLVHDGGRIVDRIPLPPGTHLQAGALEASSVNAIDETLAILTSQRAFETAQKTLLAIDATREKAANEIGRVQ
jgi:flagellar basal body rod protein FlgG